MVGKQKGAITLAKVVGRIVRVKGEELDIFVLLGDDRIVRVPKVLVEEYGEVPLNLDQEVHLTIDEDTLEKYVFYDVNN